ncbi:MAG: class I SAM-dependent methyltransferase [Chloroflexi bacterium]|nr:MAG: class I SAM-dependent methyltransferase [Chloroflexota bacterium]TMD74541.1 MAG: class I SAM-dependent methyltransferase [Chloroflexota bacterium]
MDYEEAVAKAPPGWRHFSIRDVARLPDAVRRREMARVPPDEREDRVVRALFWTLVYHLEPEKWGELARFEPIHPSLVEALPSGLDTAVDVGAGSGRLTAHLAARCRRVTAIEPSWGLLALLARRLPQVSPVAGWAEALPVGDHWAQLTASCAAFGPDPAVLAELRRVTAPGGLIALISPESPDWFEAHGWQRMTAPAIPAPDHPAWIDEFFGPLDPPHELLTLRVES